MKIKPLKITTKTVKEIDMLDLQKFIKQVYKKNYSIPSGEEWYNDSFHNVYVEKSIPASDWEDFNEWLDNEDECFEAKYILHAILHDLYCKGHIKAGKYVIHVCW